MRFRIKAVLEERAAAFCLFAPGRSSLILKKTFESLLNMNHFEYFKEIRSGHADL